MKTLRPSQLIICTAWILALISRAENPGIIQPIQFCKQDGALLLDFCVAITPYQNASSMLTDLYVTITRSSPASGNGWLGVGIGPSMHGALMFVLSDEPANPASGMKTTIRTAKGHHEPVELSDMDWDLAEGQVVPDIRVMSSGYDDDNTSSTTDTPQRTASANILIYSCALWPKTTINPDSESQPWIWAHNPTPSPPDDTSHSLTPHAFSSESGGYGFFWTDIHSARSPGRPTFPHPSLLTPTLHLSTTKPPPIYRLGSPTLRNWIFHLHGLLASLTFLLLYPLGALLLRTQDPRAFNFHWTTQGFASVLLGLGAALGWVFSRRLELVHQWVGLAIVAVVAGQILLGWGKHRFGKGGHGWARRLGLGHVWMGRGLMSAGWCNVLLGLKARGYGVLTLAAASLVILFEAVLLVRVLGLRRSGIPGLPGWLGKRDGGLAGPTRSARSAGDVGGLDEEHFELVGEDDEEEEGEDLDYDEDGRLKADVEWEARRTGKGGKDEDDRARKLQRLDVV